MVTMSMPMCPRRSKSQNVQQIVLSVSLVVQFFALLLGVCVLLRSSEVPDLEEWVVWKYHQGETVVENLLDSEDVRYMVEALQTLGYEVEENRAENRCVIKNSSGIFPVAKTAEESNKLVKLFLGNAGTAMRPLTAVVAAAGGNAR